MELIIMGVLALPLYLAAGITAARWQYNTDTTPSPEYREQVAALEAKRKSMGHARFCDTQYGSPCDCSAKAGIERLNKEIAELKPVGEPQMGTIVTWPAYLIKRAALKVYTPRPKMVSSDEFDIDEVSGAAMPKIDELEAVVKANNAFYKDEKWQEINKTWAELQARADAELEAQARSKMEADKSITARAKKAIKVGHVPKGYEAYEQYDANGRKISGFVAKDYPEGASKGVAPRIPTEYGYKG